MRKLTNSLVAGGIAALLITEVLLLLNPENGLDFAEIARLWLNLAMTYGLAMGLGFWLLLQLIEVFEGRALRPAWLSFRLLTWLLMLDLALGAILFWHNLFHFRLYLDQETIRAVAAAATTLSAGAAVLLALGLFYYSFGRRKAIAGRVLFLVAAVAAVGLPFYFLPTSTRPERSVPRLPLADTPLPRRVTLIGIEGASMSYVLPAVAEGKLPNFARLLDGGTSGPLRTLHPTESLAIWTSVATGKLPRQHGLIGFYRYGLPGSEPAFALLPDGLYLRSLEPAGLLQRAAVTSRLRRSQAFWNILSSFGVTLGLVRWWATYPAEAIDGFAVSELFHRQARENFDPPLPNLTYPPELAEAIRQEIVHPEQIAREKINRFVDSSVILPGDSLDWETQLKRRALADDATYHNIGRRLRASYDPQVYAIYFFGLDVVAHTFTRYHRPEAFGDVSDAERRKYGRVIETYYAHLDTILGEYLEARHSNEILIVLSGHGTEPLPLARRVLQSFRGNPSLSGYHERGPDGMVIFYGPGIRQGEKVQGASVVDITPTLLYLMGLPLGQDMDGRPLTDVVEESQLRKQPVAFISSYHHFLIEPVRSDSTYTFPTPLDLLPGVLDESE